MGRAAGDAGCAEAGMIFHWALAAFAGWHAAKENWVLVLIAIVAAVALHLWQLRRLAKYLSEPSSPNE